MKKTVTSLLCLLVAYTSFSQDGPAISRKPFESKEYLVEDLKAELENAKVAEAEELHQLMDSLWNGELLVPSQKEEIYDIVWKMELNGYNTVPYIRDFFACLGYGIRNQRFPEGQFDKFLEIIHQMLDDKDSEHFVMNRFLRSTRAYTQLGVLYKSRDYQLKVAKGNISFEYIFDDENEPIVEEHAPDLASTDNEGEDWFGGDDSEDPWGEEASTEEETNDGWGTWEEEEETEESSDDGWGTWGDDDDDDWGNGGWENEDGFQDWGEGWDSPTDDSGPVEEITIDSVEVPQLAIGSCAPFVELPRSVGYFINMKDADFIFETRYDTVRIDNLNGFLLPKEEVFVANGGRFHWSTPDINPDSVYCDLDRYSFNLKSPRFKAENTKMHNLARFDSTVVGLLVWDNHRYNNTPQRAVFPKFQSYNNDIEVNNFAENVTYYGGFSMIGNRMTSESCNNGPATIELIIEGKRKFRAVSGAGFSFRQDQIVSPKAKVWIYYNIGEDTTNYYIYHAAVGLKYHLEPHKVVRMRKDKGGYRDFPFESTYHGIEINADYLEWDLESDSVSLAILQSKDVTPMVVESKSYFDPYRYAGLQGIYTFHPLKLLIGYARHRFKTERKKGAISVSELAAFTKKKPAVMRGAMEYLASLNFVDYYRTDPLYEDSVYVNIKPKAIHYVQSHENMVQAQLSRLDPSRGEFRRNKHDYDMYDIRSRNADRTGPNAVISIKDSAIMNLKGVNKFVISDTMKVIAAPNDGALALGANRDTYFDGKVQVDTTIFDGNSMRLDYRNYILHMDSIKSIHFMVIDTATGQRVATPNGIQNTSGAFHIADRNNKSGMVKTEVDPADHRESGTLIGKFIAESDGFVYFDGEEIRGHESYVKERVYFKLDSGFELNSVMPGHFESGIFPKFDDEIGSMKDGALGFTHSTVSDAETQYQTIGYPLYDFAEDNPNRFKGDILLNNSGLMGSGTLDYLAGTFNSNEFVFYPDSVMTDTRQGEWMAETGTIAAGPFKKTGASYPVVELEKFKLKWLVPQDSLLLTSKPANEKANLPAEPFSIYNVDSTVFNGTLALTPKSLYGDGVLETTEYINNSIKFDFNEADYLSRNSNFIIKSNDPKKPSVAATDVKTEYSLAESFAKFSSEDIENQSFSFPYIEYQTDIHEAFWNFGGADNKLVMSINQSGEPATFTSRNRYQEELEFDGTDAIYDLNEDTLTVRGVTSIAVANVSIIPNGQTVTIRKGAEMDSLTNATIVMNRFSKYHKITEATLNILSRSKFEGRGTYTYVNDGGENYLLDMTIGERDIVNVTKNSSVATAKGRKGRNKEDASDVNYSGVEGGFRITAHGQISDEEKFIIQPGIQYGGEVAIQDHVPYPIFKGKAKLAINREDNSWFKFQNDDTTKVQIYVEGLEDGESNAILQTGLYLSQFKQVYAPFVQYKREWGGGQPLFKGTGILRYQPDLQGYYAATEAKLDGTTLKGNRVFYSFENDSVGIEGEINLLNPSNDYTFKSSAIGGVHLKKENYEFTSSIVFDFQASGGLKKITSEAFEADAYQDLIKQPKEVLQQKLAPFLTDRDLEKIEGESDRAFDFIKGGIVFSDVTFKWSPQYKAFYSDGGVLGLSSIFKEEIESYVEGVIEIPMGDNRQTAHILLKTKSGKKFYFGISKDEIKTFADNGDYMEALKKEKGPLKEAKTPATGGQDRQIADFFNRARIYAGGLADFEIPKKPSDDDSNLDDKIIKDDGN